MIDRRFVNIPGGQLIRYLLVGTWNTLFGYTAFVVLTYLLYGLFAYSYMVASAVSNFLAITVAYIGYKFFVFKTEGNYLREYVRFCTVYGVAAGINLISLPILVTALNLMTIREVYSPYIAGALLTFVTVILSFLGHRNFSFKSQPIPKEDRML